MAVTETQVRNNLNEMVTSVVKSTTVLQAIIDGELEADSFSLIAGDARDRFVRDWAAWSAFAVSFSFPHEETGDVVIKIDWQGMLDALEKKWKRSLKLAKKASGGKLSGFAVKSTPAFDNRPLDPYLNQREEVDQTEYDVLHPEITNTP